MYKKNGSEWLNQDIINKINKGKYLTEKMLPFMENYKE